MGRRYDSSTDSAEDRQAVVTPSALNGSTVQVVSPCLTIATVGTDQSSGSIDHATLMWAVYAPLTRAGIEIEVPDTSGADPDALARAAPTEAQLSPTSSSGLLATVKRGARRRSQQVRANQQWTPSTPAKPPPRAAGV